MGKGYGIPTFKGTFKAIDADLATKQFHIVKITSTGIVDFATAATDLSIGVQQNKPEAAGWPVEVVVAGETKLKAGGSITAGQFLVPNSDGEAVAVTLGVTNTRVAVARALEDADDHDIFRAYVLPQFVQV
jgi:hypothetical protein